LFNDTDRWRDYITQNDQFLLTSLPFNKRPVLPGLFWVM
jgi:hypothetical protein